MSRPEHLAPPEVFYNADEARKYASNSRMMQIQTTMSERAIELLNYPPDTPGLMLDIACGSGISGEALTEAGFEWIGLDISRDMLTVALERETDGDLLWQDMGQGLNFRTGMFDGAISISALQWLCNRDKTHHNPHKRLMTFFTSLYAALRRGARAVFQFYPETPAQLELLTSTAMKSGFTGGVLVDYPHSSKAKKYFLCLFAGPANQYQAPVALGTEQAAGPQQGVRQDALAKRRPRRQQQRRAGKAGFKTKEWIEAKKERRRKQGKKTAGDSKYAGRRRPMGF